MVTCVDCERPLMCDSCQVEYAHPSAEAYEAYMDGQSPLFCAGCEAVLVCRWCKASYEATAGPEGDES